VLRLEAHADEARGEIAKAGQRGDDTKQQRRREWARAFKDGVEHSVGVDLHFLGFAHGGLAIVLDGLQIVQRGAIAEQGFGENVGSGDSVLQGYVDADASDGGHGVGGITDAEQAGGRPVLKAIDLDGEEFDFVPGVDLGGATGEKRNDAFDALMKGGETLLLDLRKGAFGNEVSDLIVVDAIDEDDEAAVVDVAEAVFRVGGLTGDAKPQDVDGNTVVDERKMSGDA